MCVPCGTQALGNLSWPSSWDRRAVGIMKNTAHTEFVIQRLMAAVRANNLASDTTATTTTTTTTTTKR